MGGGARRAVRLTESSSSLLGRMGFDGLGPDPFGEMRIFAAADTAVELDLRLFEEIKREVRAMLELCAEFDAFDVIELLRLRELPIVPVLGLMPGYDGSAAVIELVSLVLLTRGSRAPGVTPREETQPHLAISELHDRAARLVRLGTYKAMATAGIGDDALARIAAEYQSYLVLVRGLQYETVQSRHDAALFGQPEIEALLVEHLGFSYQDFAAVRDAIQSRYSGALTRLRDLTADIMLTAQSEQRDPTQDETETFRESMLQMMFLPAERAAFTASDIAADSAIEPPRVRAVLDAFTIGFDGQLDAAEAVRQFLRGVNPLARTCLLRDPEGQFLMTSTQIGTDSFRSIAEARLKQNAKAWRRYDRARAGVSETLSIDALSAVLQTPPAHVNLKYLAPKTGIAAEALGRECSNPRDVANQTESDALFLIDDTAICVEVKGRTIADPARRGDHARLRTEIDNILGAGTSQARRLEALITANGGLWLEDGTWLDLSRVQETRSIVVGLDVFGPLAVALGDLKRAGLLGTGSLPWITSLHDLDVISQILDRPAEFLLYLRRRTDSGVAQHFRGSDELDLFMLFIDGGLYVEPNPDQVRRQHPSAPPAKARDRRRHEQDARPTIVGTYTDPLDAWMYWSEGTSPYEADKPAFNTHPSAAKLVDFLADGRKPGWFRFGADLLGLAGQAQQQLGKALKTLVASTRSDHLRHTLVQGYAGLWGYPSFFAGTAPRGQTHLPAAESLLTYMSAKKHQLQSDRSLGILLDEDGNIVYVLYLNDPPAASPELDELGGLMGLDSVGPETPRSHRPTRTPSSQAQRKKRKKRKKNKDKR